MAGQEGPGKASRVRKHSVARTPYARPQAPARPAADPNASLLDAEAPGTEGRGSLLGSVFSAATTPLRAAASLVTRVSA